MTDLIITKPETVFRDDERQMILAMHAYNILVHFGKLYANGHYAFQLSTVTGKPVMVIWVGNDQTGQYQWGPNFYDPKDLILEAEKCAKEADAKEFLALLRNPHAKPT